MSWGLRFGSGNRDRLTIPVWEAAGDFVITGLFKYTYEHSNSSFLAYTGDNFTYFGTSYSTDTAYFRVGDTVVTSNHVLAVDEWVDFRIGRTGTTVTLTINGVENTGETSDTVRFDTFGARADAGNQLSAILAGVWEFVSAGGTWSIYDFNASVRAVGVPTVTDTKSGQDAVGGGFSDNTDYWVDVSGSVPTTPPTPLTRAELDELIDTGADVTNANVSQITDFYRLFFQNTTFNQDISGWDTSSVVTMREMCYGATAFNSPINSWDTSKVVDMYRMFYNATNFNQPLSNWDVSNVPNMYRMFMQASTFNQDIGMWDVRNVTNMGQAFYNAAAFNQNLSYWDVRNTTSYSGFADFCPIKNTAFMPAFGLNIVPPPYPFGVNLLQYGVQNIVDVKYSDSQSVLRDVVIDMGNVNVWKKTPDKYYLTMPGGNIYLGLQNVFTASGDFKISLSFTFDGVGYGYVFSDQNSPANSLQCYSSGRLRLRVGGGYYTLTTSFLDGDVINLVIQRVGTLITLDANGVKGSIDNSSELTLDQLGVSSPRSYSPYTGRFLGTWSLEASGQSTIVYDFNLSGKNNTGSGQPVVIDTSSGINAVGVGFVGDGSEWLEV